MKTVRQISNLLNEIHRENPNAIIVMVSHCKIFPFINRVLKIENESSLRTHLIPFAILASVFPTKMGSIRHNRRSGYDRRNNYYIGHFMPALLARLPHYRSVAVCGYLAVCQTTAVNPHGLFGSGLLRDNTVNPDWR